MGCRGEANVGSGKGVGVQGQIQHRAGEGAEPGSGQGADRVKNQSGVPTTRSKNLNFEQFHVEKCEKLHKVEA